MYNVAKDVRGETQPKMYRYKCSDCCRVTFVDGRTHTGPVYCQHCGSIYTKEMK
jgi:ribosomal protein S27E